MCYIHLRGLNAFVNDKQFNSYCQSVDIKALHWTWNTWKQYKHFRRIVSLISLQEKEQITVRGYRKISVLIKDELLLNENVKRIIIDMSECVVGLIGEDICNIDFDIINIFKCVSSENSTIHTDQSDGIEILTENVLNIFSVLCKG